MSSLAPLNFTRIGAALPVLEQYGFELSDTERATWMRKVDGVEVRFDLADIESEQCWQSIRSVIERKLLDALVK